MGLSIVLLLCAMSMVECVDRGKLATTPPPQKKFNVDKYMGDWYMQARLPPCAWSGSGDFTNCVSQYSKQPAGNVHLVGTWRSGESCATATINLVPKQVPGVFVLKDPIGDLLSGENIIVATDYKKLAVEWGCAKYAVDGTCGDPYVGVRTRKRDPSPHTWKAIEAILDHLWSLGLTEMIRDIHDKNACVKFKEPVHHYVPSHSVHHLSKTY